MTYGLTDKIIEKIVYYSPLFSAALLVVVVSLLFYFEREFFGKLKKNKVVEQIIIGIVFGACVVYANEIGSINVDGALINARDASPLCAGLLFGAPAGIIAGVIGGTERWFSVYWGAGTYTRLGCSLACVCAGLFAAFLRNFIFMKKRPNCLLAFVIALVSEVAHLLLVFVTHPNDARNAFIVCKKCATPIITATCLSVFLVLFIVNKYAKNISYKKNEVADEGLSITTGLQRSLLATILITFLISLLFEYKLLRNAALSQARELLVSNVYNAYENFVNSKDVKADATAVSYLHIGENGNVFISDKNWTPITYPNLRNVIRFHKFEILEKGELEEEKIFNAKYDNIASLCLYKRYKLGNIIGYYPKEEVFFTCDMVIFITSYIYILVFTLLYIVIYLALRKIVVKNVDSINVALGDISNGNLDNEVNVRKYKEFEIISDGINKMVGSLKKLIVDAENRVAEELDFAKKIQHSTLPIVSNINSKGIFDIYASMDTAKEVGGDFYDFYFTSENRFVFLIADVSGKGIPAAMIMMKAKSVLKGFFETESDIQKIVSMTNNELCDNNEAEMFVTSFICSIDLDTGIVDYVNAGHNPPIFIHADGSAEYFTGSRNLVLAGMDGINYKKGQFKMEKNDAFYMYTDGVTEAINKSNELFGEERLLNNITNNKLEKMQDLCNNISVNLDTFVDGVNQFDDITMVAFKYKGVKKMKEITVVATIENVEKVTEFINTELEKIDCPVKAQMQIDIAIDELFSNIAYYAYNPDVGEATVRFEVVEDPLSVVITFMDNGVPYDPIARQDPNVEGIAIEDRDVGGLGIFMVKKSMDDVEYEYSNGKNILRIKKNI